MVRLFCLMHACAMEDLCNKGDHFKLLDIEAFLPEDLKLLEQPDGANTLENPISMQIQYVFIWIKYLIVQGIQSGLLDVPPPILTRAYQEIGAGMAQFHNAQMISMWPFPFPYAQLSLFLSVLHLFLSPIIMLKYTSSVWASALLTYISIVCVMSLNIIGVELENPFGEDTNDLPAAETHEQFRHHILLLADPGAWQVPRTKESVSYGFEQLRNASGRRVSLKQHLHSTANLDSPGRQHGPEKATDTAGDANGPANGPNQNPQSAKAQGFQGGHGHGHDPGAQGQGHHGGEHFADPKQVEILERWLSRQSSMLESFLTKQQALMEQMLRFRNVEARSSAPNFKGTPRHSLLLLLSAGEGFKWALGLHSRGLLLHQRDATEASGLKLPSDHPDRALQAAAAPEAFGLPGFPSEKQRDAPILKSRRLRDPDGELLLPLKTAKKGKAKKKAVGFNTPRTKK
ncbi:unnamed protein product [Symbiodinium sp. CCMP2592]|nr:unnamed protein product [Symbiodinium sp. CCMP2592]